MGKEYSTSVGEVRKSSLISIISILNNKRDKSYPLIKNSKFDQSNYKKKIKYYNISSLLIEPIFRIRIYF